MVTILSAMDAAVSTSSGRTFPNPSPPLNLTRNQFRYGASRLTDLDLGTDIARRKRFIHSAAIEAVDPTSLATLPTSPITTNVDSATCDDAPERAERRRRNARTWREFRELRGDLRAMIAEDEELVALIKTVLLISTTLTPARRLTLKLALQRLETYIRNFTGMLMGWEEMKRDWWT